MKKKLVSIIIPCYNVSSYLNKCLDSVLNSTLKDIEVIAINDGSKDNTLDILKSYKDKRLVIIDKKNEGVAMARNDGLAIARGEYIAFLDSDDYVDIHMYEDMYKKAIANDLDMVACDTNIVYMDHSDIIPSLIDDKKSNKDLMIDAYAVIWNKLYKASIIKDLRFSQGINLCEDVEFLYKVYARLNKIGGIAKPYYNYVQREGSLTYVYDSKIYHIIHAMDNIIAYYKDNNIYDLYKDELEYTYIRYSFATFIKRLSKTKDKAAFNKGYKFVKDKVHSLFPHYRKNKYLNSFDSKIIYLKYFNVIFANIIFYKERNKGN